MFFEARLAQEGEEIDFLDYLGEVDVQNEFDVLVGECLRNKKMRQETVRRLENYVRDFERVTDQPLRFAKDPCFIERVRLALYEIVRRLPPKQWVQMRRLYFRLDRAVEETAGVRLCWAILWVKKPRELACLKLV